MPGDMLISILPYILPSSVCCKPFVFTLFTKPPGHTQFLPESERYAVPRSSPFSIFTFPFCAVLLCLFPKPSDLQTFKRANVPFPVVHSTYQIYSRTRR